jgi:3-hydroxyisobutyrate dehydrogenase-like beta-hydroxyacid dehydrogenase
MCKGSNSCRTHRKSQSWEQGSWARPWRGTFARQGFSTAVWNRTAAKAAALSAFGAVVADHVAEAIAEADIVISMLSDGPTGALVQADQALRAALRPGTVWVEMGSIKPEEARAAAEDLARLNVSYVDAPVSGRDKRRRGGQSWRLWPVARQRISRPVAAALSAYGAAGARGADWRLGNWQNWPIKPLSASRLRRWLKPC